MRSLIAIAVTIVVALFLFTRATYTLNPGEQAMVFRFNQLIHEEQAPGLHFRVPFVDEVERVGAFVYEYDGDAGTFLALNAEPVVVDYYITYRIVNLRTFQEQVASSIGRLEDLLKQGTVTAIQTNINSRSQSSILAEGREELREQVFATISRLEPQYGISIESFRINRVDLPEETKNEFENSMILERNAERDNILTRAEAQANIIKAEAERNAALIRDGARQQAQTLIGLGTKEEIVLKDQGFGVDPAFFTFYKRVEQILDGQGIPSGRFVVSNVDTYLGDFLGFEAALANARTQSGAFTPLESLEISEELQNVLSGVADQ